MAELQLKIGDHVHYGSHGVCQVCGREEKCFGGTGEMYFTLRPTGSENILLYLPENAQPEKVKLRRLLSRQEILTLIRSAEEHPPEWIADNKVRREAFSKTLRSGDAGALICMLRDLYFHQKALPEGRQLPTSDQEMMTAARRQLHGEFAYGLGMEEREVLPFILDQAEACAGKS